MAVGRFRLKPYLSDQQRQLARARAQAANITLKQLVLSSLYSYTPSFDDELACNCKLLATSYGDWLKVDVRLSRVKDGVKKLAGLISLMRRATPQDGANDHSEVLDSCRELLRHTMANIMRSEELLDEILDKANLLDPSHTEPMMRCANESASIDGCREL